MTNAELIWKLVKIILESEKKKEENANISNSQSKD